MKQIPFTNHKGEEFLFVKLPKDASDLYIHRKALIYDLPNNNCGLIRLKSFDYKLISPLSEMTEELWRSVVDEESSFGKLYFKNYAIKHSFSESFTSTESGQSLLKSLGIYLVNPFGKHPDNWEYIDSAIHMYKTDVESWEKKEANTGNWIILKES